MDLKEKIFDENDEFAKKASIKIPIRRFSMGFLKKSQRNQTDRKKEREFYKTQSKDNLSNTLYLIDENKEFAKNLNWIDPNSTIIDAIHQKPAKDSNNEHSNKKLNHNTR